MEYEMQPYIVYVKLNEYCEIIAVNSSAFLKDTKGWHKIDSGYGVRFHHAQGNYFDKPIMGENGVYRYEMHFDEYDDGDGEYSAGFEIITRTDDEMAELYEPPEYEPSQLDRIEAQTLYTALMTDTLIEEV